MSLPQARIAPANYHGVMFNRIIIVICFILLSFGSFSVVSSRADSFLPADDFEYPTNRLQTREQFQQAEDAASQRRLEAATAERSMENLSQQKSIWEQEVATARSKMAATKERLDQATATGMLDEINNYQGQYDAWEKRLKTAVVELENIESSISEEASPAHSPVHGKSGSGLVQPGESIEVFVSEDDTLHGVYAVRQGGYIIMPRVGRISVAGLDMAGVEKIIKDALAVDQIKDATIMVERPQSGGSSIVGSDAVIYLAGEFIRPGAWRIPSGLSPTLVTTILRSGGLSPTADLSKVRLLRLVNGQSLAEEVNVQAILNGSGLRSDVSLQSGDIVMVPPYANVVYVTGNVMKPGALKLLPDDELTAYSAVLRAGGFSRFANRNKVYVLRELGNGDKQKIPVSIRALQEGGGGDLVLKSKDIVVVPERFLSF